MLTAGLWTLWLLSLQALVHTCILLLSKLHLKQRCRAPKLSAAFMLVEDAKGYLGWTWMLGLHAAWINPGAPGGWTWDYSCPNLVLLGYYALAVLMCYDAYSFVLHKWMHSNKTAFRLMHSKHHEYKASLDVTTSGYMSLAEGAFSSALPMLALYCCGMMTGNWWYTLAGTVPATDCTGSPDLWQN